MTPAVKTLSEKKLIGMRMNMSLAENKTPELWRSFMLRRKEITNTVSSDLYSMQVYDASFDFITFNPHILFEKWAAMEVLNFDNVPKGMDTFTLPGALYAVFLHKGSSRDISIFQYIFGTWLPNHSEYMLDNRPHFELLGEKYKNDSPDSEEEIWIPVKMKNNS
jgi:AraC family transcriptional regulator